MDHEFQLNMERLYNKNQTIPRIRKEFEEAGFGPIIAKTGLNPDFAYGLLAQMVLHKRAKLTVLVGLFRGMFNSAQEVADNLLKAAEFDLVDYNHPTVEFVIKWNVSKDVIEEIDRYQYPLPMFIEPMEVKTNRDTGYLTIHNSIILRNNHHDDDVCLDHINSMNTIPLQINTDVVRMTQNKWKHLDKPKENEEYADYQARKKAFEKYDRTSREVLEAITVSGNRFYLTHKYDKRGRTYCQGYHVTYQGAAWNKAVIEFARGECVEGF